MACVISYSEPQHKLTLLQANLVVAVYKVQQALEILDKQELIMNKFVNSVKTKTFLEKKELKGFKTSFMLTLVNKRIPCRQCYHYN